MNKVLKVKRSLCWIRRDLRLHDNHALSEALKNADECIIAFIFDKNILDKIKDKNDSRISFIFDSLAELETNIKKHNSSIIIRFGDPLIEIPNIISEFKIDGLFFNRDYEPYAKKRDIEIINFLTQEKVPVFHFKDHVFFEKNEILNGSNETYKVFTPYKNKWLETFKIKYDSFIPNYKTNLKKLAPIQNKKNILNYDWFKVIGFNKNTPFLTGGTKKGLERLSMFEDLITHYKEARDIPSLEGTSSLSPYIRFGNISIRDMIRTSLKGSSIGHKTWLSELIWRDFYHAILDTFPYVEKKCFRKEYDDIEWLGSKTDFKKWCEGQTGFPIVDSAMRCLNTTGLMHNRLRMVVASFLTKTLLIDWKLGEKYFAEKLLDYDMAANNGGWQWSASTGVDAQPYFRIFNPYNQSKKFDPYGIFIRRWCPELAHLSNKEIHCPDTFSDLKYPHPIVSYKKQREVALSMYKKVKAN